MKEIVNREQAEKELTDFFDAMDIDTTRTNEDAQTYVDGLKEFILGHIIAGRVSFNENYEPVVKMWRTKDAKPLTVKEPTGANLMAAGAEESILKASLNIIAELTEVPVSALAKLKAGEIKLLRTFYTFFTA